MCIIKYDMRSKKESVPVDFGGRGKSTYLFPHTNRDYY